MMIIDFDEAKKIFCEKEIEDYIINNPNPYSVESIIDNLSPEEQRVYLVDKKHFEYDRKWIINIEKESVFLKIQELQKVGYSNIVVEPEAFDNFRNILPTHYALYGIKPEKQN